MIYFTQSKWNVSHIIAHTFVNKKRAKIKSRCQYKAKVFIGQTEYDIKMIQTAKGERSGSVVECLTQDQGLQV